MVAWLDARRVQPVTHSQSKTLTVTAAGKDGARVHSKRYLHHHPTQ